MLIKIPNDAEKILYWVDEINYDVLFLIYFERFENANNGKREERGREIERDIETKNGGYYELSKSYLRGLVIKTR